MGREEESFSKKVHEALHNVDRAIDLFGCNQLSVSFNGGKDATVVFQLVRMALARRVYAAEKNGGKDSDEVVRAAATSTGRISALSLFKGVNFLPEKVTSDNPNEPPPVFPELLAFFEQQITLHSLPTTIVHLMKRDGKDIFKNALERYFSPGEGGHNVKGIIMGTRHSDPHAVQQRLSVFTPSTPGWPAFMRINPIMEWDHSDVWSFLLNFSLPYCRLYDEGYTSMGAPKDSKKNPSLRRPDGTYAPAHTLVREELERSGREVYVRAPDQTPAHFLPSPTSPLTPAGAVRGELSRLDSHLAGLPDEPLVLPEELKFLTSVHTCGILTIGHEVLTGKVIDQNSREIVLRLRAAGIEVTRIVMVSDNEEDIAAAARSLSSSCDIVVSTGGIGPTHDDVTMKAMAGVFGTDRVRSAAMESAIRCLYGEDTVNEHQLGMALVPRGSVLLHPNAPHTGVEVVKEDEIVGEVEMPEQLEASSLFKIVLFKNIFILPGVPVYMRSKLKAVARMLKAAQPNRGILYSKFIIQRGDVSGGGGALPNHSEGGEDRDGMRRDRGKSESGLELQASLASTLGKVQQQVQDVRVSTYVDAREIEEGKGTGTRQRVTVIVEGRDSDRVGSASSLLRSSLADQAYTYEEVSGEGHVSV